MPPCEHVILGRSKGCSLEPAWFRLRRGQEYRFKNSSKYFGLCIDTFWKLFMETMHSTLRYIGVKRAIQMAIWR